MNNVIETDADHYDSSVAYAALAAALTTGREALARCRIFSAVCACGYIMKEPACIRC